MKWVKIKRNDNYSINELGQVRNDVTNRIKKSHLNKQNGYYCVDLYRNNKCKKVTIHRLLAEAFIPNIDNKPTVDHIDGDRVNNSIDNLRWATYSENNSRFKTSGVRSEKVTVTKYIEKRKKRGGGHESWVGVGEVIQFNSITETAKCFGTTVSNISLMLNKGTIGKRGITRGYQFKYTHGDRATHS